MDRSLCKSPRTKLEESGSELPQLAVVAKIWIGFFLPYRLQQWVVRDCINKKIAYFTSATRSVLILMWPVESFIFLFRGLFFTCLHLTLNSFQEDRWMWAYHHHLSRTSIPYNEELTSEC
jgi:hypothetical protein